MKVYYNGQYKIIDKTGKETIYKNLEDIPDYKYTITEVEIEDKTTTIERCAFAECYSIEKVIMPNSVIEIDDFAFVKCESLSEIKLSKNLQRIGTGVFERSGLEKITLPDSVLNLDSQAFCECDSLVDVKLPKNITKINMSLFLGCTLLKEINIPECVTEIASDAFRNCIHLEKITFPKSLNIIQTRAFANCIAVSDISFPDELTKLNAYAFLNCENIKKIKFPNKLKDIDYMAFHGCHSLKEINIPYVETINTKAFENCENITKVTILNGNLELAEDAFNDCKNLKEMTLPNNIQTNIKPYYELPLRKLNYRNINLIDFKNKELIQDPVDLVNAVTDNEITKILSMKGKDLFDYSIYLIKKIKEINNKNLYLYYTEMADTTENLEKIVPRKIIYKNIYRLNKDLLQDRDFVKKILKKNRSSNLYTASNDFISLYHNDSEIMQLCAKNISGFSLQKFSIIFEKDYNNDETIQELMTLNPVFISCASTENKEVFLEAILDSIKDVHYDKKSVMVIRTDLCNIKIKEKSDGCFSVFIDDKYLNMHNPILKKIILKAVDEFYKSKEDYEI